MARINTTRPSLFLFEIIGPTFAVCGSNVGSGEFYLRPSFLETATMRSVIVVILTIYLIGAGIALLPTIRSTPASAMSANVGQEMPYALAWPARLVRDTSIGSDSTFPGPRPPKG
jgi:hypothetical protein